ncbi:MAG TPA: glycosyltransferase family 2 protein [Terriglobia bacterium]|nr:glycosyltransferase family 2 protein [Terriglobia bacterium]
MRSKDDVETSVVIPLFNEAENVAPLYMQLTKVLQALGKSYEIIFVNDGSRDRTQNVLDEIFEGDSRVKIAALRGNSGQTAALKAGFDAACGKIILSMDGDLQHDPKEIPAFLAKMEEGYDIVSGWRAARQDHWLTRRLPSRIANWLMAKLSGVSLHDFGTTFKAYRREIIQNIPLYGDLHRFIPALARPLGARIAEIPITNPPRENGKSNYGLSRVFHVFFDLISTKFLLDYSTRPLHFFGPLGLTSSGMGGFLAAFLLYKKLVLHSEIMMQNGPLLFASSLLILAGIQLLCLGLASEILSRTYYESQGKPIYAAREIRSHSPHEFPVPRLRARTKTDQLLITYGLTTFNSQN